ncbi:MAG TPA: 2-phospho-L-lactate guanylyltransferase [Anaerolineaceae bacterium]|nr:2-phospho-L-lactate guanylyltransferase [Anaerolineaceae bacterium]HPN50569.1 2-phospho-L-lactate guanylyltransferase [Anaerolineaceae bacterium]
MSLWAIVPVKPLRRGKSRLASVMNEDQRAELNQKMLQHILDVLGQVPEVGQVLVVSRDSAALALAREHNARTVQEDGAPQLNTALKRATAVARIYATQGVLLLPADLPLVRPEHIRQMVALATQPPVAVIVPDRRRDGTNAMLLNPAGLISDYNYGPGSFKRHCEQVVAAGMRLEVAEIPAIALDLDLPEDLEMMNTLKEMNIDL